MKLFKISQIVNNGYDTYDSAVVVAEDEEKAAYTHPRGSQYFLNARNYWATTMAGSVVEHGMGVWAPWDEVEVEYLGEAREGMEAGVVCASFNAG